MPLKLPKQKSEGLGDSIEKFTTMTGIKSLAQLTTQFTSKKDCGCSKRKEALNKLFPYKK